MSAPRRAPRGLTAEEAALWSKVAQSVTPLHHAVSATPGIEKKELERLVPKSSPPHRGGAGGGGSLPTQMRTPLPTSPHMGGGAYGEAGLDSHWERRLARNSTEPEFTLDLHGHNLEQAHRRLDTGIAQAKAMGARLVLLITGKPRPVDAADRGERRGAIRAKVLDWLAAGPHASDIAAIKPAQRRHGGEGALYLVLRRRR